VSEIIYGNFNAEVIKAIKKSFKSNEVNPLYIHGSYGSGKSFLVEKMKHEYNGEPITIEANNFDPSLIDKYIDYDLLILSDLELLSLSSPIPETLFEILSYFIDNKKQIVFTSDRPPYTLDLSNRIISRIESGVVVKIKPFDKQSKERVIKTLGKDLPSNIIKDLIEEDIETISQAMGAIKRARVLGYVVKSKEEKDKVKKLFYKKPAGEFDRFVNEIRETFSERIDITEKEQKLREEYGSKMYVWQMKGFNTDRIKKVIDGPIDKLTGEFVSFTMDIQRLIELQRKYGTVNIKELENKNIISKDDIEEIEKALFNPDKIDYLITRISEIENQQEKLSGKIKTDLEKEKKIDKKKEEEIKEDIHEEVEVEVSEDIIVDNIMEELKIDLDNKSFRFIKEI
jgi:hypothetical protein